ncbi:MAG: WD40 repeat domain-containing protein [Bacteroidia bacterium]|nr:WD40 repeat domain-containing protein [Bacteroidia bacterium]
MFGLFKKEKKDIQEEWNKEGERYASEVLEMQKFGETHGWENWKGKEPEDKRDHLAEEIIHLLKKANNENKIEEFRRNFPPAHSPLISIIEKKSQSIEQLYFIENQKIVFLVGTAYQKRQAYLLNNGDVLELDSSIRVIGKSNRGNVFAIAIENKITTFQGWEGSIIKEFKLSALAGIGITKLIPFNNGLKILVVTSEGIYIISENDENMICPVNDNNDNDWTSNIDMENATLSNDNEYIVVGSQDSDHIIFDKNEKRIGSIGPQSSYPHFCLFSKNDDQLITNSCHFYNGITIGVDGKKLNNINIEAYQENGDYLVLDEEMRVYVGLSTSEFYILGDAYGYIRAFDKQGNKVWKHFLGSTISGIAISNDEKTLWIGSFSGMLHKLQLGKGHRDKHTLGTGNHYEEFRLIIWRDEDKILKW